MRFLLLLLLLATSKAGAVCFGPCFPGTDRFYEIRSNSDSIEVECSRFYDQRREQLGCLTDMKQVWNLASASVNEFSDMERAYEEEGREGAEKACEKVCAGTNSCKAFGVSSDKHVAEGEWQCIVYFACIQTQFNEHLDLYKRLEPLQCLIKATSFDGVFVNYMEGNGGVSQTSRLLTMQSKAFFDLHVQVNDQFNTSFNGYRPYKKPKKSFCEQYDSDCVILHAGGYSAVVVSVFCIIVAFNSCVLYVSLTKPNDLEPNVKPQARLRKTAVNSEVFKKDKSQGLLFRRSNKITF